MQGVKYRDADLFFFFSLPFRYHTSEPVTHTANIAVRPHTGFSRRAEKAEGREDEMIQGEVNEGEMCDCGVFRWLRADGHVVAMQLEPQNSPSSRLRCRE